MSTLFRNKNQGTDTLFIRRPNRFARFATDQTETLLATKKKGAGIKIPTPLLLKKASAFL